MPAVLLVAIAATCLAPASHALEPITTVEGITEYQLDNGLRVLLYPDPSKPTFTVNVTYRVGSRHEGRGEKGMAHLLEHMVFKGTPTYDDIWGALEEHGAAIGRQANGSTWVDRTNYFETLPASDENLEFVLHMEADRMVNSLISAEDLATEMTVVRNEFEMGENNPLAVLSERMAATAYLWHPYGNSTIGNRSDIERVPIDKLQAFYRRYYQPDNAMLVVAGRFDVDRALALIEQHFGAIPRPERVLDPTYTEEPTQDGPRMVTLERVGDLAAAGLMYHVPAGSHPDFAAVQVLEEVLSSQPSGRLYTALVESGLASSVYGSAFAWKQPGILDFYAEVRLDEDVRAVLGTMTDIVEGIASSGITDAEVERIKTRQLKNIKLAMTNSGRIGVWLSEWEAMGDWRMLFVHRDRLKEVTTADVQRVAEQYLLESNRTAGLFVPTEEPVRAEIPETPDVASIVEGYTGSETIELGEAFEATPAHIEERTARRTLDSGIHAALLAKETRGDAVRARFRFHFGTEEALTGHETELAMLPPMLMRGTETLTHEALRDSIDRLQARIDVWGGAGTFGASIETDRAHLAPSIELLGDILRRPAFDAAQFEIVKNEQLAAFEEGLSDPTALGRNAMQRAMNPWPPESIHYVPTLDEQITRTEAVTLEALTALHGRFYGAGQAEVAVVGDFDETEIAAAIDRTFEDWPSPEPYVRIDQPYRPIEAASIDIDTPDKPNAMIARGTVFELRDDDPDYPAMRFANYVLGGSASSRLKERLRQREGLSYWAGSFFGADPYVARASLSAAAICAAPNAARGQVAMREEIDRFIAEGVPADELADAKQSYRLTFMNDLSNDGRVAGMLAEGLEIGRTMQFQEDLLAAIDALTVDGVREALQRHLGDAEYVVVRAADLAAEAAGEPVKESAGTGD
jgi:zinc protease